MSGNTNPIFSRVGDIQWSPAVTAANTALDGTGATATAFTADSANGGYLAKLRAKSIGANVATVARVFINNGADPTVAANNVLFEEINLPATTLSQVNANQIIEVPVGIMLPPGYKILITLGTAVAAGWTFIGVGGKF